MVVHEIINFQDCPYSNRHGSYTGMAGDKDGILYNDEPWIIKFPKSTKFMQTDAVSYVSSPLSEYIGSHIYQILGYDTHETKLGIRRGKIVVGCRDFRKIGTALWEIKSIKNAANEQLAEKLEQELHHSSTGDRVNLNEMILHLKYNPILQQTKGASERFWDMAVVDVLIDNSDRNNGNWGILRDENTNTSCLAPVYDNGNAFTSKASDEQLAAYLRETDLTDRLIGGRTAYDWNGKLLSAKKLLKLQQRGLQEAIIRNVAVMNEKLPEIRDFIQTIPEFCQGKNICSPIRKEYYIRGVEARLQYLLEPAYKKLI